MYSTSLHTLFILITYCFILRTFSWPNSVLLLLSLSAETNPVEEIAMDPGEGVFRAYHTDKEGVPIVENGVCITFW